MRMYDQVLVDLLNLFVFGKYFFPLKEVVSVNELYNFGLRIFFFFGGGGGGSKMITSRYNSVRPHDQNTQAIKCI